MDVFGSNERLWIDEHEREDGSKWRSYRISVGKRVENGYLNAYIRVAFAKKVAIPADLQNGSPMTYEGFMTIDKPYTDRNGAEVKPLMIMITKAEFGQKPQKTVSEAVGSVMNSFDNIPDSYEQLDEDVPF